MKTDESHIDHSSKPSLHINMDSFIQVTSRLQYITDDFLIVIERKSLNLLSQNCFALYDCTFWYFYFYFDNTSKSHKK